MLVRVRAAAATLDLGLADVKQRGADAARRLTRLGAARVEAGEPHEDDRADPDPMARMRASAMLRRPRPADAPLPERPGVNIALTAAWDIAALSAEEVLALIDQLRFDAATAADPPENSAEPTTWSGPEEQMRSLVAQMTEPPPADRSPKFLFVTRPSDEQLARAATEAYGIARRLAERLAHAAGGWVSCRHSASRLKGQITGRIGYWSGSGAPPCLGPVPTPCGREKPSLRTQGLSR
ncbi:MAG TPA: hypothetical protein VFW33_13130 [Gemmataceae bacterium]|nr:hypothetical protein [Gemmataceae bacterium]